MRKLMLFTVILVINASILIATATSAADSEQEQQNLEHMMTGKMHFLGSNSEFSDTTEITQGDVQLMWEKVQLGIQVIDRFWQVKFAQNGLNYRRPQVKYYTSPVSTGCGPTLMNNAVYCSADHTIYYDAMFLTKLMKGVGSAVGSDGDMAVIFVMAHEWGHAVQGMNGRLSRTSIFNENNADCSAGAFTLFAHQQGWLEKGDMEEAAYTVYNFGDDLPWHADGAHGPGSVRLTEFAKGVDGGLVACGGGFSR